MSVRHVALTIPTLTSGGAERVLTTMANWWARHGVQVTVVTLASGDIPPAYPLDPLVRRVGLDQMRPARTPLHAIAANLTRVHRVRRELRNLRPDVVISFLNQMNEVTILATRGSDLPVIVTEHTDPGLLAPSPFWDRLRRVLYPRADQVVVLTDAAKRFFSPTIQTRTIVLPNPIVVAPASVDRKRPDRPSIVALGRLAPEKGFDMLIDAFARVAPSHPEWDLVIHGEGPLRGDLEAQRDRLGLASRVHLPGRTANPHDALRDSDIYVLTSRREGFPMGLAEALACGLPAVAFDLPSGPRDIIRDGIDGVLTPSDDIPAFADALAGLMDDPDRRATMASRAPEVLERFGVDRIMARWETVLAEVAR